MRRSAIELTPEDRYGSSPAVRAGGPAAVARDGERTFQRASSGREDAFRRRLVATGHLCDHRVSLRVPSRWTTTVQARAR
jgi:hypothetical protein